MPSSRGCSAGLRDGRHAARAPDAIRSLLPGRGSGKRCARQETTVHVRPRQPIALAAAAALTLFAGCKSEADDLTLEAVDALAECDVRTAHELFTRAHASDPDHPQAALGFALTDLAL